MKNPKVVITIPTFNSEPFIERCLSAIKKQTYKNIDVNIIDGGSQDNTLALIKKAGFKNIFLCKDALLAARYEGVMRSNGEFILLLDSDQILERTSIQRAVELAGEKKVDMIVLEEHVYNPHTFLDRLFVEDRKLIHNVSDFSPMTGVVLPRFYRKTLLKKAMETIPKLVIKKVGGQDHAIIYYEAWQISKKVAMLHNAVSHIEPSSYPIMWRKFYRWGKTSADAHQTKYDELLQKKERFRTGLFTNGLFLASCASISLLILKGIPYKLGYFHAKLLKR